MLQVFVKSAIKFGGAKIDEPLPASNFGARAARIIVGGWCDLVSNIGIDIRMFAKNIRKYVHSAVIVAVEPRTKVHVSLVNAPRNGLGRHVMACDSLSATPGLAKIIICGEAALSPLLAINNAQYIAVPVFARGGADHLNVSTPLFMITKDMNYFCSLSIKSYARSLILAQINQAFRDKDALRISRVGDLFVRRLAL